uniref:Ig-like domain-containing protein n=1 Tax=Sus scrofa TaxID=9823 RepID=A0A8D1VAF1_PIG
SSERQSAPSLFPLVSCVSPPSDDSLVALGCLARDFLPSSVTFSWNYKNSSKVSSQNIQDFPSVLRGGKYLASSRVLLPSVSIPQDPEAFLVCEVQHPSGTKSVSISGPASRQLPAPAGTPGPTLSTVSTKALTTPRIPAALAPSNLAVRVLTAPGPLAFTKAASWLLCEVSSFSPLDILLTWLEGQQEVDPSWFATARPAAQPGNPTFRTWSVLRVPASPGHQDATYTCVVGHEASRTLLNASWRLDTGLATLTPGSQDEGSDDYVDLEDAGRLWLTFTVLFLVTLLYSGFVTFLKVK